MLKAANPNIKLPWYQAMDRGDLSPFGTQQIMAHPSWWLRDDNGNVVWFGGEVGKHPVLDTTVPAVQQWFVHWAESHFANSSEFPALVDGIFFDGCGLNTYPNMSDARLVKLFEGRMQVLRIVQDYYNQVNGGDVWWCVMNK